MAFVNKRSGSDMYLSFYFPSETALLHIMNSNLFTQEAGCDNDTTNTVVEFLDIQLMFEHLYKVHGKGWRKIVRLAVIC